MHKPLQTLQDWLDWQESLHVRSMDFDLKRLKSVFNKLLLGKLAKKVITVAGTNGKGSTVAMLQAIYTQAGYKVGAYTSPHILKYNERVQINGHPVSDDLLIGAFHTVEAVRGDTPLTYYECGTLAAFMCFADADLDIAILEVGLGGRLDATNIIDSDAAIFTSFSYDHQQYLGDTLEEIAAEKAEVMRPSKPAYCGHYEPPHTLSDCAERKAANLQVIGQDYDVRIDDTLWRVKDLNSGEVIGPLVHPKLSGKHQFRNAASLIRLIWSWRKLFPLEIRDINKALASTTLPGRCEIITDSPQIIIDVAHNEGAVAELASFLGDLPKRSRCFVLLAILEDKIPSVFFEQLEPYVDRWFFAQVNNDRAFPASKLKSAYLAQHKQAKTKAKACSYHKTVQNALKAMAKEANEADRVVITGSFYTVSETLENSV